MEEAFSRKTISMGSLAHLTGTKRLLAQKIQTLESMFVQLGISERGGLLASIEAKSMFIEESRPSNLKMEI